MASNLLQTKKERESAFSHKNRVNYKIILGFALFLLLTRAGLGTMFTSASDITVENVASAVNAERSSRNLTTLNYNTNLGNAADFKSKDMIARKYFSHTNPEGQYIWDKIVEYGYTPYTILGENLAVDFSNTEGLVAAWIASPTHRANILHTSYKDQGMGVAYGNRANGEYSVAITNTFGAQPQVKSNQQPPTQPKPDPEQPKPTPTPEPKPTPTPDPEPTPEPDQIPEPTISPVVFEPSMLSVNADVVGDELRLNVFIPISGSVESANATVLDQTVALKIEKGGYAGTLSFEKYFDYKEYTLVLSAISKNGEEKFYNFALKNIDLAPGENPKDLGNLVEKAAKPDLYNTFKYIVIIFGGLFLLFLFADTLHLSGKKGPHLTSGRGSHLIVLFLMISTMLLVSWWN